MPQDKFSAVWVSHSSMGDFLKCPRLYYLRNVYKDPKTGHKITVMTPHLALGQVVHDVLESLSFLPVEERFKISPLEKYETAWEQVKGKKGGFKSVTEETEFKERGKQMIKRVVDNPGPILEKAVKIKGDLPYYWIDEEENIILCGKIDWLQYKPDNDSVHIVDFKTGKNEEKEDSLQLPIYSLLVNNTQERKVDGVSYWYLDRDDKPMKQKLPDENAAAGKIMDIAKRIKLGRQIEHFKCPHGGCRYCTPFERVLTGEGEKVAESAYRQDIYVLA